jgi:ferric-dicitrate binding protein FerR (iron transport regulator)
MLEPQDNTVSPELVALLEAVVLQCASDADVARLNELLLTSAEMRQYAAQFLQDETRLRSAFEMLERVGSFHRPASIELPAATKILKPRSHLRRMTLAWTLAAAVSIVTSSLLVWRMVRSENDVAQGGILPQAVASFGGGSEAGLKGDAALEPGNTLRIGDIVDLRSGLANLRFFCGVDVCLKGPATLKILSPMRAALERGTLTARVEESAHGFRIDTPNSKVVDLGTEFGVAVDEHGSTDMVVFSGKVTMEYSDLRPDEEAPSRPPLLDKGRLFSEGEAMRVTSVGALERVMAVRDSDYPRSAVERPDADQWPAIIDAVSDNFRAGDTNMCYQIAHNGFREDARAYVDRPYQWNGLNAEHGLPLCLRRADYVMTFCDDKLNSRLEMHVTLNRAARLYVLIDNRVDLPKWLTDKFHDTGYDVGVDENALAASWQSLGAGSGVSVDKTFSVWYMDVRKPGSVALGALRTPIIQSMMYCVAAMPLDMALALEGEPVRNHQPRIGRGFTNRELLPKPLVEPKSQRVENFADLTIAKPSDSDAASATHGVKFRLETMDGKLLPHPDVIVDDGVFATLNDGRVSQNADDRPRSVWYDGQGRFSVDFLRPRRIEAINTFSWHRFERASQFFTVWGSAADVKPPTDFEDVDQAIADGWQLIAQVNTRALGDGAVHASSISALKETLGPYRHLLWIAEHQVRGTFFTEIDVHTTPE